jgi:phospholipase/lecithinase/hemolysin
MRIWEFRSINSSNYMSDFMMLVHETLCFLLFLRLIALHATVYFSLTERELIRASSIEEARIHSGIKEWNEALERHFLLFQEEHNNITAAFYDTSRIFHKVLDDPERYGFKDSISVCSEDDCIWFNDLHPAYGLHRLLAEDLERFLRDT